MANVMKISGPAPALLLLAALLAAGVRDDDVTTAQVAECRGIRLERDRHNLLHQFMSRCNLTAFPQHQLSGLPALAGLFLSYNKLRELPVFDEHVCANLTELDLHNNRLTGIYNAMTFSACSKLVVLDLSFNLMQLIDTSVFTALTNLRDLDLQSNMIRYIPNQLLASNGKLEYLDLHGNRLTHLPPEFASRRKRAGAGLDWFYFYSNPWHCACLIELLADVRRAGVRRYYTHFHDGGAPVCVYSGAAPCRRRAPAGLLRGRGGR